MLWLNIRTTQPMIGMNTQQGVLSMKSPPLVVDSKREQPQAGIWPSEVKIDVDSSQSRAAYGCKSVKALVYDDYQRGIQGVLEGVKRRSRECAQMLQNGAKQNVIAQNARSKLVKQEEMRISLVAVPDVDITVTPSQMQGENDAGSLQMNIRTEPVETDYQSPNVKTYLKQQSDVRMWTSEGGYDIYA